MAAFNDFSLAATESNPLISQMSFVHKPQVGGDLFDVNPMETDTGVLMAMGLVKEVKGETIIHHEANKRFVAPQTNIDATVANVYGVASVGNGDPAKYDSLNYIQLHANSHTPSDGTDAGNYSYPREGDQIQFPNKGQWRVQGKRTSVTSEHRLYLKPINASQPTLANTITTGANNGGEYFIIIGTAWDERSQGQLQGLVPSVNVVTNGMQVLRDHYEITDFAERDETYPLTFQGKQINFMYNKGLSDTDVRFAALEDYAMFLSQKDDGTLNTFRNDDSLSGVSTTHGYIPQLEDSAQKLYYSSSPTMALFENMIRIRRKRNQGNKAFLWMGYEFGLSVQSIISEYVKDTGTPYDTKDLDLNIRRVQVGGFTFDMKELQTFNHPQITAAPGFDYPFYFVVAPTDKTKDHKTGIMEHSFCMRYKKQGGDGARGHYKIWEHGGNSKKGTNGELVRIVDYASRKGMQVIGAENFILGKKA